MPLELPETVEIFKCFQIVYNQLEVTFVNSLYPMVILFFMSALVFLNLALLKLNLTIFIVMCFISIQFAMFVYLYCFVILPSFTFDSMNDSLRIVGTNCISEYTQTLHKSIRPFKFGIGQFYDVSKNIGLEILHVIINYTVSMLLVMN